VPKWPKQPWLESSGSAEHRCAKPDGCWKARVYWSAFRGAVFPESRLALRRQLDVLHETAAINDPARQVEEDYRFHRLICEISGNRRLLKLFDDLASELRIVIGLIGRLYDDPHRIAQTHEPLLVAIESGDAAQIQGGVEYHLGDAWRGVAQLVRNLPANQTAEKAS
jgi:DNA-binding FadR family transcriptional regulator